MDAVASPHIPPSGACRAAAALVVAMFIAGGMSGCDRRAPKPPTPAVAAAPAEPPGSAEAPVAAPAQAVLATGQPVPRLANRAAEPVAPATPGPTISTLPGTTSVPPTADAQLARSPQVAARPAPLGEVVAIEPIRERPSGSGAGAVIGGVLGAVVGNQFGHGHGRTALTVAGAAGGAVVGNNVERNVNTRVVAYRVRVRLASGASRVYEETRLDGLRVGDRVRVEGRHLRRT